MFEVKAIGLKITVINWAIFHNEGILCISKYLWKIGQNAGVNSSAQLFNKKAEIPSGPVDFLVQIPLNNDCTQTECGATSSLQSELHMIESKSLIPLMATQTLEKNILDNLLFAVHC